LCYFLKDGSKIFLNIIGEHTFFKIDFPIVIFITAILKLLQKLLDIAVYSIAHRYVLEISWCGVAEIFQNMTYGQSSNG